MTTLLLAETAGGALAPATAKALTAAKEIGGSLAAQSDGVGRGACFILELPVAAQRKPVLPAQVKS